MRYPRNKGLHCKTWQRVGRRRLLRCAEFEYPRRRFQMGFHPGHIPANFGASCVRRQQVFSPWYNKKVWRCAKYGPGGPIPFRMGRGPGRGPLITPPPPMLRLGPGPRGPVRPALGPKLLGGKKIGGKSLTPGYMPQHIRSMERVTAGLTPINRRLPVGAPIRRGPRRVSARYRR